VAAAVEHPRDNYRDDSGFATDLQTFGAEPHRGTDRRRAGPTTVGSLIDRARIGHGWLLAGDTPRC